MNIDMPDDIMEIEVVLSRSAVDPGETFPQMVSHMGARYLKLRGKV